jgi:predicted TIM-barrel fold metal-dependent hydrolase
MKHSLAKALWIVGFFVFTVNLITLNAEQPCLNKAQRKIRTELRDLDPRLEPLPQATPIIDIHTHTFNARYLPLRGILLGKRDAFVPITTLISDRCAGTIAQAIIDCTELSSSGNERGISRDLSGQTSADACPGLICSIFLGIIKKAIAAGVWDPKMNGREQLKTLDNLVTRMSPIEKLALKTAAKMMGMGDHTKGGTETEDTISGSQAAARFVWILTQKDSDLPNLYRMMHADAPAAGHIAMVSQMMDLGPVYDQIADGETLLDFEHQQVTRVENFVKTSGSDLMYFVAYNPYRSFLSNASPCAALDLVQDTVQNHGAIGIKLYPPSGYRPSHNKIKGRPCSWFSSFPGREWDARYGNLGHDKNNKLDQELNRLLEWCIRQDVPVLTHSGYGEFEARKGYGEYHANPIFWQEFLESHSTPGNPCKLRLCLGHAGGEDYWFGVGSHADWGKRCYEICTKYPNVYCEVTTSERLIQPNSQAFLVDRLATLFTKSTTSAYPFHTKLLYGTDWPLPDQGKPGSVLLYTQKAFLHPKLKPYYEEYFVGNARRFLKLQ